MKFNIGDKLHISGDITVTGANKCGDGIYSYSTEVGTFHEPALEKLVCKTASVKPQDKPKFAAGCKAKVIANKSSHKYNIGHIVTLLGERKFSPSQNGSYWATDPRGIGYYVLECDLEPYAEHAEAPAPVKLYCVKSYRPGEWMTKGKTYEHNGGIIVFDDGYESSVHDSLDEFFSVNNRWRDNLVPLVARPAKAGEWVYIAKSPYSSAISDGAVLRVINANDHYIDVKGDIVTQPSDVDLWHVIHSDYLTLDGYDGRYEETESKFYSGKVVCVESRDAFTVGKVYEFKDGKVNDDEGDNRPMADYRAETLESWNEDDGRCHTKFIEYKGEAT